MGRPFYFLADPIDGPIFRWQVDFIPTGLQPWWGWYFVGSHQPAISKKFMVFSRCFCWKSPRESWQISYLFGTASGFWGASKSNWSNVWSFFVFMCFRRFLYGINCIISKQLGIFGHEFTSKKCGTFWEVLLSDVSTPPYHTNDP